MLFFKAHILIIFSVLLIVNGLASKNKYFSWFVFLILPIFLTPYWLSVDSKEMFTLVKMYSVIITAFWINLLRFTNLSKYKWAFYALYLMFVINLIEVIIKNLLIINLPNIINAVAGIMLVLTLDEAGSLNVNNKNNQKNVHFDKITLGWIIGYLIFNLIFIYLNYLSATPMMFAVLFATLIVAFIDPTIWLQTRVFTLLSFLMIAFTFRGWLIKNTTFLPVQDEYSKLVFSFFSFIYMFVYSCWFIEKKLKRRFVK